MEGVYVFLVRYMHSLSNCFHLVDTIRGLTRKTNTDGDQKHAKSTTAFKLPQTRMLS
jgi:hypothetical protein